MRRATYFTKKGHNFVSVFNPRPILSILSTTQALCLGVAGNLTSSELTHTDNYERYLLSLSLNVPIWHSLTTILIPCHHSSSLFIHIPFRPKCTQKISISPCAAPNARKTTTPPTICYLLSPALFACPPRISKIKLCNIFVDHLGMW